MSTNTPDHVLFVASYAPSLQNFRGPLIDLFLKKGWGVSVASSFVGFNSVRQSLYERDVTVYDISLSRTGLDPFQDICYMLELRRIILRSKPNVVISYTAKPVIYTGVLLCLLPSCLLDRPINFVPMITGLGLLFSSSSLPFRARVAKEIARFLYKLSMLRSQLVIFQNPDDLSLFKESKLLSPKAQTLVVSGSGVDLFQFAYKEPAKKPIFLMLARLLKSKGIVEYIKAAEIVKTANSQAVFCLAGMLDASNPDSIDYQFLSIAIRKGTIEYLGELSDVQESIEHCRFYVLPSYREGLPRSVLEALSMGRPILTTDVPGCRETVINGVNGFLVPHKNSDALALKMFELLQMSNSSILRMSLASRKMAEMRFDVDIVNGRIFEAISTLA